MDAENARTMDDAMLAAGLGATAIVQRAALPAKWGAECEIVTCRMPQDGSRQLVCKFGPLEESPWPEHRYGVAYEAQVYDELLPAWKNDVPRLHGFALDAETQTVVLAFDFLEGATPLHYMAQPRSGLLAAAEWIARFHAWGETATVPAFLQRYDTDYYRLWLDRAAIVTRELHPRYPWLPPLCERGRRRLPALLPLATVIHGDYRANNIVVVQGRNVPGDWQSVALAAGEIDLASLTQGWDDGLAALCERHYCRARWPRGVPEDFALRLMAARVFLHVRRLGNSEPIGDSGAIITELDALAPLAKKFVEMDR